MIRSALIVRSWHLAPDINSLISGRPVINDIVDQEAGNPDKLRRRHYKEKYSC